MPDVGATAAPHSRTSGPSVPPVQDDVSKEPQLAAQASVPPSNPWLMQVAVPRSVPSQTSASSMVLLPQFSLLLQPVVSKAVQSVAQASSPPSNPWVAQVAVPSAVPSQTSAPSIWPSPQVTLFTLLTLLLFVFLDEPSSHAEKPPTVSVEITRKQRILRIGNLSAGEPAAEAPCTGASGNSSLWHRPREIQERIFALKVNVRASSTGRPPAVRSSNRWRTTRGGRHSTRASSAPGAASGRHRGAPPGGPALSAGAGR